MYNTKLLLISGQEIYPGYLDKEKKQELRALYRDKREYMWCGCKDDHRLYYRISEDLKIYPEHNNYVHDRYCSRYRTETGEEERKTGYLVNDETGDVIVFLSFNPKDITFNDTVEKEEDNPDLNDTEEPGIENEVLVEKDEGQPGKKDKKEPELTLASLIRSINVDSFFERLQSGKKINSREVFSKQVYYRMRKVKPSRMKKSLGDLTLENDGVRFIYLPLVGAIEKEDKGLTKCYLSSAGADGKVYNNFIFPETMNKTIKEFVKMYGIEPDQNTMMSGFQYLKKGRSNNLYKVLGRIHLFQVSNVGIYCRSLVEKDTYDLICRLVEEDNNILFWIPADDDSVGGIIEVKGKRKKILLLFRSKKDERITYNDLLYEPLVIGVEEPVTRELLYNIIDQME